MSAELENTIFTFLEQNSIPYDSSVFDDFATEKARLNQKELDKGTEKDRLKLISQEQEDDKKKSGEKSIQEIMEKTEKKKKEYEEETQKIIKEYKLQSNLGEKDKQLEKEKDELDEMMQKYIKEAKQEKRINDAEYEVKIKDKQRQILLDKSEKNKKHLENQQKINEEIDNLNKKSKEYGDKAKTYLESKVSSIKEKNDLEKNRLDAELKIIDNDSKIEKNRLKELRNIKNEQLKSEIDKITNDVKIRTKKMEEMKKNVDAIENPSLKAKLEQLLSEQEEEIKKEKDGIRELKIEQSKNKQNGFNEIREKIDEKINTLKMLKTKKKEIKDSNEPSSDKEQILTNLEVVIDEEDYDLNEQVKELEEYMKKNNDETKGIILSEIGKGQDKNLEEIKQLVETNKSEKKGYISSVKQKIKVYTDRINSEPIDKKQVILKKISDEVTNLKKTLEEYKGDNESYQEHKDQEFSSEIDNDISEINEIIPLTEEKLNEPGIIRLLNIAKVSVILDESSSKDSKSQTPSTEESNTTPVDEGEDDGFASFMNMILDQLEEVILQSGGAIIQDDLVKKYTIYYSRARGVPPRERLKEGQLPNFYQYYTRYIEDISSFFKEKLVETVQKVKKKILEKKRKREVILEFFKVKIINNIKRVILDKMDKYYEYVIEKSEDVKSDVEFGENLENIKTDPEFKKIFENIPELIEEVTKKVYNEWENTPPETTEKLKEFLEEPDDEEINDEWVKDKYYKLVLEVLKSSEIDDGIVNLGFLHGQRGQDIRIDDPEIEELTRQFSSATTVPEEGATVTPSTGSSTAPSSEGSSQTVIEVTPQKGWDKLRMALKLAKTSKAKNHVVRLDNAVAAAEEANSRQEEVDEKLKQERERAESAQRQLREKEQELDKLKEETQRQLQEKTQELNRLTSEVSSRETELQKKYDEKEREFIGKIDEIYKGKREAAAEVHQQMDTLTQKMAEQIAEFEKEMREIREAGEKEKQKILEKQEDYQKTIEKLEEQSKKQEEELSRVKKEKQDEEQKLRQEIKDKIDELTQQFQEENERIINENIEIMRQERENLYKKNLSKVENDAEKKKMEEIQQKENEIEVLRSKMLKNELHAELKLKLSVTQTEKTIRQLEQQREEAEKNANEKEEELREEMKKTEQELKGVKLKYKKEKFVEGARRVGHEELQKNKEKSRALREQIREVALKAQEKSSEEKRREEINRISFLEKLNESVDKKYRRILVNPNCEALYNNIYNKSIDYLINILGNTQVMEIIQREAQLEMKQRLSNDLPVRYSKNIYKAFKNHINKVVNERVQRNIMKEESDKLEFYILFTDIVDYILFYYLLNKIITDKNGININGMKEDLENNREGKLKLTFVQFLRFRKLRDKKDKLEQSIGFDSV